MTSTTNITNTQKHRLTLFINNSIIKHARAQAIIEDVTLTKLFEKALIDYLPLEIIIKKPQI